MAKRDDAVVRVNLPIRLLAACSKDTRAECIRDWLSEGMRQTGVAEIPLESSQYVSYRISQHEAERLKTWARLRGLGEQLALTRVARLAIVTGAEARGVLAVGDAGAPTNWIEAEPVMARIREAGITPRPEQPQMAALLAEAHDKQKIAMLEAATGCGKTMVFAAHAVDLAAKGERVAIAAPTLSLVRAVADEVRRIAAPANVNVTTILGRSEFVSETSLRSWLAQTDETEALTKAQAWLGQQDAHGWRLEDLVHAAPEVPAEEVRLHRGAADEGDAGYAAYRRQFDAAYAQQTHILVLTHAMLAMHLDEVLRGYRRARGDQKPKDVVGTRQEVAEARVDWMLAHLDRPQGTLPWDPTVVILDEAHLFPERMRSALSTQVSFVGIARRLRRVQEHASRDIARRVSASADHIERLIQGLSDAGGTRGYEPVSLRDPANAEFRPIINELQHLVADASKAANKARDPVVRREVEALSAEADSLRLAAKRVDTLGSRATIALRWSPSWRYPVIDMSQQYIAEHLALLWRQTRSGALVSATLYEHRMAGLDGTFMAGALGVPAELIANQKSPIIPRWLRDGVVVHQVQPRAGRARESYFHTPAQRGGKNERRWTIALASAVEAIAEQAAGGTLIYCTAYETVRHIQEWLAFSPIADRVIASHPSDGASGYQRRREQFLTAGAAGARPVWLATGRIQQGESFTLENVPPDQDFALTDLVVTKLPFGPKDALDGKRYYVQEMAMFFAFRQLIGRLIRGPGYRDRQLWLLDPRAADPSSYTYAARLQSVVREYQHIEAIAYDPERAKRLLLAYKTQAA